MNWFDIGIRLFFIILALFFVGSSALHAFVLGVADIAVDGDISRSTITLVGDFVFMILVGVVTPVLINRHRQSS